MTRGGALVAALLVAASCGGEDATPPRVEVRDELPPRAGVPPSAGAPAAEPARPAPQARRDLPVRDPARFPGAPQGLDVDAILAHLREARPTRFKPVGSTSVVFKVDLDAPISLAYRPRTKLHPRGWLAEIAAWRVARALGMDNVPPAVSRRFQKPVMRDRFDPEFRDSWSDYDWHIQGDRDGAKGVAVYWVEGMRELGWESGAGRASWERGLSQASPLPEQAPARSLLADVSTMVAFDYVIANFDRWSGGNVRSDPAGRRIIVRDHNLAFVRPVPDRLARRMLDDLRKVERFSRSFVARLAALDADALRTELALDPMSGSDPALDSAQIRDVVDRAQTVLSHVGTLIEQYGPAQVLAFP